MGTMHEGLYIVAMHGEYARWLCTVAMHSGYAQGLCPGGGQGMGIGVLTCQSLTP